MLRTSLSTLPATREKTYRWLDLGRAEENKVRVTSRQLRRIIRESLLNESAELKKLKKILLSNSGLEGEQAWELADSLGLSQQFEAMLGSDN